MDTYGNSSFKFWFGKVYVSWDGNIKDKADAIPDHDAWKSGSQQKNWWENDVEKILLESHELTESWRFKTLSNNSGSFVGKWYGNPTQAYEPSFGGTLSPVEVGQYRLHVEQWRLDSVTAGRVEHHAFRCHSSDLHAALNAEKLCAGGSPCWKAAAYPKQEAFSIVFP